MIICYGSYPLRVRGYVIGISEVTGVFSEVTYIDHCDKSFNMDMINSIPCLFFFLKESIYSAYSLRQVLSHTGSPPLLLSSF